MSRQLKQAAKFFLSNRSCSCSDYIVNNSRHQNFHEHKKNCSAKYWPKTHCEMDTENISFVLFEAIVLNLSPSTYYIQTHRAVNEDIDFQQCYPDSYPLYDQRRIINVVQHVCSNMDGVWRRFVCVWHQKFHFIRQSVNSKVMYNISLTCVSIKLPPSQSSEIASKKMHTQNLKASHNGEKKFSVEKKKKIGKLFVTVDFDWLSTVWCRKKNIDHLMKIQCKPPHALNVGRFHLNSSCILFSLFSKRFMLFQL